MNLGPNTIASTYQYILNQSGNSITLGNGGAVSWASNGLLLNTGNQLISGVKTFADDSYMRKSLTVSGDCLLGNSSLSTNVFGGNASSNEFGKQSINQFGEESTNNFGSFGVNDFGINATNNRFGLDSVFNSFGSRLDAVAVENYFGSNSVNYIGTGPDSINYFGSEDSNNQYASGLFSGPIKLFLPQFSGSSSQTGQTGELKVSGSGLYICTGTNAWGRIFISSF